MFYDSCKYVIMSLKFVIGKMTMYLLIENMRKE
jgi:hypothetical protein